MRVANQEYAWERSLKGLLACVSLLGVMPAVCAGQENSALIADETAILGLYFSDEHLVEAATRHPKPISQVAENVTVITAAEIEAMHAHSVAEILERVPGIFVLFKGRGELGSLSSLSIHHSDYEHVLVLVDGIRWNYVASDFAETNTIPVDIIDRIEVIKGAASSAWGSALGGVVNIITKSSGRSLQPRGEVGLALGEHDTFHYHAELAGAVEDFGYYLYAGQRKSDGIRNQRFINDQSLFGKFSYELTGRTRIGAQVGYSQPENRYHNVYQPDLGDWADFYDIVDERFLFYAAELDSALSENLYFYFQFHDRDNRVTNIGGTVSTGDVSDKRTADEEQQGINSRLVWEQGGHTLVVGAEYLFREVVARNDLLEITAEADEEEIWSFFLNDTIRLGRLTITPGLRYDHLTLVDDQLSPSLGATYRLTADILLRAAASRGFRKPAVVLKEGDPYFYPVNPDLENETIWTYQVGLETTAIPYLWLKATGFHHEADHVWVFEDNPACIDRPGDPRCWVNNGSVQRTGFEISARTIPVYHLSLGVDYTFARLNPDNGEDDNQYKFNLHLDYNDTKGLQAQIFGNYIQWSDLFSNPDFGGKFDAMIWDLVVTRTFFLRNRMEADLFFKVHNLFNGSQFHDEIQPNTPRWLEAGLRFRF